MYDQGRSGLLKMSIFSKCARERPQDYENLMRAANYVVGGKKAFFARAKLCSFLGLVGCKDQKVVDGVLIGIFDCVSRYLKNLYRRSLAG